MHQRSCATVSAGVHIFSPPGFLRQEPGGDERQGLMMMPASPRSNLVVRQACFSLGTLQALLDAMLPIEDTGKLRQRRLCARARESIIVFERPVRLPLAEYHQDLFRSGAASIGLRRYAPLHGFDDQRPFLARSYLDRGPGTRGLRRGPAVHAHERNLRMGPTPAIRRRLRFDLA